jgi:hypothetical protein
LCSPIPRGSVNFRGKKKAIVDIPHAGVGRLEQTADDTASAAKTPAARAEDYRFVVSSKDKTLRVSLQNMFCIAAQLRSGAQNSHLNKRR